MRKTIFVFIWMIVLIPLWLTACRKPCQQYNWYNDAALFAEESAKMRAESGVTDEFDHLYKDFYSAQKTVFLKGIHEAEILACIFEETEATLAILSVNPVYSDEVIQAVFQLFQETTSISEKHFAASYLGNIDRVHAFKFKDRILQSLQEESDPQVHFLMMRVMDLLEEEEILPVLKSYVSSDVLFKRLYAIDSAIRRGSYLEREIVKYIEIIGDQEALELYRKRKGVIP